MGSIRILPRILIACGCLLVPTWLLIAQDSSPDVSNAELLKRIDQLEKRITELEQKMNLKPKLIMTQPLPDSSWTYPLYAPNQKIPKKATPRDFNGTRYYNILINGQQDQSTATKLLPHSMHANK